MGEQNALVLSALRPATGAATAAAQIADANAPLKTQAGAWRSRSPQQEEVQTTAKHKDDGYANEQDCRH